MKLKYNIIPLYCLPVCRKLWKKEASAEKAPEKTEQKEQAHEEAPQTIASLNGRTDEICRSSFGNCMKELTSTIKANGLLSVPNSNKATITSLYGGIIKTINIQVGSIVKKDR
jgi:multidrug efflux pump subunit AcrA (membrane-fusion protein)